MDAAQMYGEISPGKVLQSVKGRVEWANRTLEKKDTGIVPGKGWEVMTEPSGICDGTYDSICNRGPENDCMLQAYQSG